ncbi:MAG TPA: hypothetical protein VK992_02540, partial [Candidatus Caenarcaniphilales bacterium]|nr:hypothetical protein [Candidatus Caenarcaniphilales bacterium]
MTGETAEREPSSFRDPTGFVYRRDGQIYRQIHAEHAADWEKLYSSGLYSRLVERGWLVEHEEVPAKFAFDAAAWRVVRPRLIEFVSYPYEWTFGQLRDAALLTLDAQTAALDAGLTLKDASAYNVQFEAERPVLIDPLSFEQYEENAPWVAYRQFCQHFLAPLALMAQRDVRLGLLLRDFIDGVPLDLAARLLPLSSRVRMGQAAHLHLHARAQRSHGRNGEGEVRVQMSRTRLEALLDSLRSTIEGLRWQPAGTEWADYGLTASYSDRAAESKRAIVQRFLEATDGTWVWDLGANTGFFSRIAADLGRRVLAIDGDPAAAEQHYRALRQAGPGAILPLVIDLANPSPSLGWAHGERRSLVERANADTLIALA